VENLIINPDNYQGNYINYLNQCFDNWGGNREYEWVFNRTVGDKISDIIIIKDENNETIAGSGITYRKIDSQNGGVIDIAIMTGSWTLPKARGRGCFSKIIQISREISNKKGVTYLTAFVTENNASFRRLKVAGSFLLPSYYLFSQKKLYDHPNSLSVSLINNDMEVVSDIYNKIRESEKNFLHFNYTLDEFCHQYIKRPNNVEIVQICNDYALIEEVDKLIKVHLITYEDIRIFEKNIKSLLNWGLQNRSKKLFLFSTRKEIAEICDNLAFENMNGYYTIIDTSNSVISEKDDFAKLDINMGDKM
jgi:hypothetical protein